MSVLQIWTIATYRDMTYCNVWEWTTGTQALWHLQDTVVNRVNSSILCHGEEVSLLPEQSTRWIKLHYLASIQHHHSAELTRKQTISDVRREFNHFPRWQGFKKLIKKSMTTSSYRMVCLNMDFCVPYFIICLQTSNLFSILKKNYNIIILYTENKWIELLTSVEKSSFTKTLRTIQWNIILSIAFHLNFLQGSHL